MVNNNSKKCITLNGTTFRSICSLNVVYYHSHALKKGSFVDRGTNSGLYGTDVRFIKKTRRSVDSQGIGNHQITDVPYFTAGAIGHTHIGPVIVILHQYAYIGNGKTIHSSGQLESFNFDVNDKYMKVNG